MIHGKFMNSKKNTPDVPHEVTESRKKRFTIHENYLDPFIKNVGSALFPTRSERNLTKQLLCKICPRAIYFCFLFCHSATLANNEIKRTNCQYNAILYISLQKFASLFSGNFKLSKYSFRAKTTCVSL